MDVFVARQPIFTRKKKLYAYELLFRDGLSNTFPDLDGDTATSTLLSSSFFSSGIEKISSGKVSFINFTEPLLLRGTPSMFPHEKIMVEILENVAPTREVIDACRQLKKKNYTLALDDFEYNEKFEPLLELTDIVKVDFRLTPHQEIREMVDRLQPFNCSLLAEKIETYEEFDQAYDLGFKFFQGYFFSKPEILKNRDIPPAKVTVMKLINEVNREGFNIESLERTISTDVAVTYKLLKYLNSAYYSRLSPVKSVCQAIAYLGEQGTKMFVTLIAASKLAEGKPQELVRMSIVRARFLEQLGVETGENRRELFMLGLFSLIDAMLDNPMDYLVEQLPLSDSIAEALIHKEGRLALYLKIVDAVENGDWAQFGELIRTIKVEENRIRDMYIDSVAFAANY